MACGLSSPDNALQVEKAIRLSEFRPLGVHKCFERLGWEEALSFRDEEGKNKIPREAIYQWMATLKKDLGSNPPRTTTLTGKVGNKRQIYKQTQGEEVSLELKELLFQPGSSNKERKDLNILPKLCAVIGGHNIIPCTSDKGMVRVYELRMLAALVTGVEMLSLRQLVMSNVWGSRNKEEEGDTEESGSESESESETETEKATRRLKKAIHEHVVANRPTEYAGWDRPFQMLWDQNVRRYELQKRRLTKLENSQERHALALQWAIHEEVNDRHRDAEARRRYDWVHGRVFKENPAPFPWDQLQPYQGGHIPFSYPKTHASRWVPLQVPPPPSEPSVSGSSDAFDFHSTLQNVEDMFKEYFEEQVKSQPCDHHYNPSDYQPPGSGTH
ncbi:hypothetical protein L1987_62337 [Smallanthus sonchifolius]|uniref:Uncharacterized protein n=1 Tax=Smallanthus sonchifolius TaxID=185202 RepID=A0ACB9CA77_9ASTR|nr:hypothetical protein L1987_62337 [Smallanthus sonchifolius]